MKKVCFRIVSGFIINTLIISFFLPAGFVSAIAAEENFCEIPADIVLVLDVSGSMEDGGSPNTCLFENLEWYQDNSSQYCASHSEINITEQECLAKPDVPQCDSPVFIPSVPSKIESAKNAAKSFLNNLKPEDQSALVTFSDVARLPQQLSYDHEAVKSAVDAAVTIGATNIGDAIARATEELESERGNPKASKTIIFLTDGKANMPLNVQNPELYAEQKAQEAADLGYKIFTIGLGNGSDINETMLANIANITGASYHHAPNGSFLIDVYQEISQEICQYGSISGCKYSDLNNNGTIDETEPKLAGWEIALSGDASQIQLTDETGCYTFAGLLEGNYTISESENADKLPFVMTYPVENLYNINLAKGENLTDYNFINYLPVCGNNILDQAQGEQCDDGNTASGDGCSSVCQIEQELQEEPAVPVCGNIIIEEGEQCDDGNTANGDGCSSVCQTEEQQEQPPEEPVSIQQGDIVINEIMQNPKAVFDAYGEWFEFYNTTDADIDLSGCVIKDVISDFHTINSLIAPANSYSVLGQNGDINQNGGAVVDYVYFGTTLGNSSDQIILECNGIEIDRVEYGPEFQFPNPNGASMSLASPALDNNVGANWCLSVSVFGTGDKGTPGVLNDSCAGVVLPVCGNSAVEAGEQCDDGNTANGDGCSSVCQTEEQQPPVVECVPVSEVCNNNLDDDCDGAVDSSDSDCQQGGGGGGNEDNGNEEEEIFGSSEILAGDILINEIMHNPEKVLDDAGEWFEIYNTTNKIFDLYGCTIKDSLTDIFTVDSSVFVSPNSYAIFANSNDIDRNGGIVPDYTYTGMILSGPSDQIILECNGLEIDRVEYDGGPQFPIDEPGSSMILKNLLPDNNTGSNWCISSSVFGLGDKGTPGFLNDVCIEEVLPICGNNLIETGEQCDDGNTNSGDGCSSICQTEEQRPVAECSAGQQRTCNTGIFSICSSGIQVCSPSGLWGVCVANNNPIVEICNNTLDDDCDGNVDASDSNCQQTNNLAEENNNTNGNSNDNNSGGLPYLSLSEQSITTPNVTENSITFTWTTNRESASYIIYSERGQPHSLNMSDDSGNPPKYGYAYATIEYDTNPKVTLHSVTITGLKPATTYYFRVISRGSLAISLEYVAKTNPSQAVLAGTEETNPGETPLIIKNLAVSYENKEEPVVDNNYNNAAVLQELVVEEKSAEEILPEEATPVAIGEETQEEKENALMQAGLLGNLKNILSFKDKNPWTLILIIAIISAVLAHPAIRLIKKIRSKKITAKPV